MDSPLIKICGITRVSDAVACAELGVDLLGLNFYPRSPRYLEMERAREIADSVRGRVELVGIFVNSTVRKVEVVDRRVGLDRLQFHGYEPAEMVNRFGNRAVRAFRVDPEAGFDVRRLDSYPDSWGFLFDVAGSEGYGGSGLAWPYETISSVEVDRPTLIAGGVGPENARDALERSGAGGVDVCSGVESAPGVKDPSAIERLVREVRGG
jgi:phosphoribosylanthranilate isomerase